MADVLVNFIRVSVYEVPCVRFPESILDLFVRCVGLTHQDVLLDRRIEKDRFLADITNLLAVVAEIDVLHVNAVNEDIAGAGIVESLNKLHSCGLA